MRDAAREGARREEEEEEKADQGGVGRWWWGSDGRIQVQISLSFACGGGGASDFWSPWQRQPVMKGYDLSESGRGGRERKDGGWAERSGLAFDLIPPARLVEESAGRRALLNPSGQ